MEKRRVVWCGHRSVHLTPDMLGRHLYLCSFIYIDSYLCILRHRRLQPVLPCRGYANCDSEPIIRTQICFVLVCSFRRKISLRLRRGAKPVHFLKSHNTSRAKQRADARRARWWWSDAGPPRNGQTSHRTDQLTSPSDQAVCLRRGPTRQSDTTPRAWLYSCRRHLVCWRCLFSSQLTTRTDDFSRSAANGHYSLSLSPTQNSRPFSSIPRSPFFLERRVLLPEKKVSLTFLGNWSPVHPSFVLKSWRGEILKWGNRNQEPRQSLLKTDSHCSFGVKSRLCVKMWRASSLCYGYIFIPIDPYRC